MKARHLSRRRTMTKQKTAKDSSSDRRVFA